MTQQKKYQKSQKFILRLAKSRGWLIDQEAFDKSLKKENPRFLYFPITDARGKKFFFKACPHDSPKLCERLKKELLLQQWLTKLKGPVRRVVTSGRQGGLYWYVGEYLSPDEGIVCQEEYIDPIKISHVKNLAKTIVGLWKIEEKDIPPVLSHYLFIPKKIQNILSGLSGQYQTFLITLRQAFLIPKLDWQKKDEQRARLFLDRLPEIVVSKQAKGVFVHGDLAPNNIFFGQERIVFFDWEAAYWSRHPLLDLGADVACFYTRCWQKENLGKTLVTETKKLSPNRSGYFSRAINIALVVQSLLKLFPMIRDGQYKSEFDQRHFNTVVSFLREALCSLKI